MNIGDLSYILCCCILGVAAFYWQSQAKYTVSLVLLVVLGFVLHFYTALDFYLHVWDERYHALVAKHLMQHPLTPTLYEYPVLPYSFDNWAGNHIWVHKQPLSLWGIALSLKLFGINEIAVRLPSILLSTLGIVLMYKTARYFFNQKVAFIAAFFYAINGLIIDLSAGRTTTDHPDIFLLFFVQLGVYFSILFIQRKNTLYTILTGICIGAALLSKWLPGLIIIPIWFLLIIDSKQLLLKEIIFHLLLLSAVATIVFLPWQIYIHNHFPTEANWERRYNARHFVDALEGHSGTWHYYLDHMRIDYGELIYAPIIWIICLYYKEKRYLGKLLALICWFMVPIVLFSFAATKMRGYILITAPALFMVTAAFFIHLSEYKIAASYKWLKQLILLLLLVLPIRYCIERVKPFEQKNRQPDWVMDLKKHSVQISNKKTVLFGYKAPIEAMFYTEATVYETIPDSSVLSNLMAQHYTIFVAESPDLPAAIRLENRIRIIDIIQPD